MIQDFVRVRSPKNKFSLGKRAILTVLIFENYWKEMHVFAMQHPLLVEVTFTEISIKWKIFEEKYWKRY